MYLSHFGLHELPFGLTPDPSFTYICASHQRALDLLFVAVRNGEGFIKITGEVGTGKTLLCRRFIGMLDDSFVTAYIPNPYLEPRTLLLALADELGVRLQSEADQHQLIKTLTRSLLDFAAAGKSVVVGLDEVQAMPIESLEALRLLSNLETDKKKLLHIVLFGQPELDEKLAHASLRQLRQRITSHYCLRGLGRADVRQYLTHRLRVAGYRGEGIFSAAAVRAVYESSVGIPRLVNVIAHKAMVLAFGQRMHEVARSHVVAAALDTPGAPQRATWWRRSAFVLPARDASSGAALIPPGRISRPARWVGIAAASCLVLYFGHYVGQSRMSAEPLSGVMPPSASPSMQGSPALASLADSTSGAGGAVETPSRAADKAPEPDVPAIPAIDQVTEQQAASPAKEKSKAALPLPGRPLPEKKLDTNRSLRDAPPTTRAELDAGSTTVASLIGKGSLAHLVPVTREPSDMERAPSVLAARASPDALPPRAVPAITEVSAPRARAEPQVGAQQAPSRELAESEYRSAMNLLVKGAPAEAQDRFKLALQHFPAHVGARQALYGMMLDAKKTGEAEQLLADALTLNPEQPGFAMALARLQLDRGAGASAIETLRKTALAARDSPDYMGILAALLQRHGRHDEAIEHYQAAVRLAPQSGIWLMGLGVSLQAVRRHGEAEDAYRRAKATNTLNPHLQAFVDERMKQAR